MAKSLREIITALLLLPTISQSAHAGQPEPLSMAATPRNASIAFFRQKITALPSGGGVLSAADLLQQGERVEPDLLPRPLPRLPAVLDPVLRPLLDRARAVGPTNAERYLWLERQAAVLSSRPAARPLARALRGYLTHYKSGWAPRWIARRLHAFAEPAGRPLCSVSYAPQLGEEERRRIAASVSRAEQILTRAVHPALWRRWPVIRVEVSDRYVVAGITRGRDGERVITLRADSSVTDVLHELGHVVGYHGGLRPLAMAHAVRARRAYGRPPEALHRLLPGSGYRADVKGYDGGYVDKYMGRYYADGYTEVLSLGIERFHDPARVLELLYQDGDYLLLLLTVLQSTDKPHSPRR